MSRHSVVEAKNNLSELISRAEGGEEVVITRHGQPVVELKAVQPAAAALRQTTEADIEWLASVRVEPEPGYPGGAALIRQIRDESY